VLLAALRFRVEGEVPDLPDFVVGMAAMFALDLRLAFIGKHTLFRGPLGAAMRWMGGIPVDRASPHGVVAQSVEAFARMERRILAIAPEGTRRRIPQFKSGFLHIARGAHVPVVLAALDYGARCVRFGPAVEPGADVEADRKRIEVYFAGVRGKHPR
jgi:1-acyl-sn-glycerol-3-phosphate acyltransferase